MEVALPAMKRHPPEFVQNVLETVNELIHADGRVDVFEYLLARVVSQYLWEAMNPHVVRNAGRKSLSGLAEESSMVMAILARHGHEAEAEAAKAYQAGATELGASALKEMPSTVNWTESLDESLTKLDRLKLSDKEILVKSLIVTVTSDGNLVAQELELLRAVCAMIHVPVPMIPAGKGS
jgi:hypothetical protein